MPVTIRKATTDDAALLARLNYTVHQLHLEQMPERYKPTAPDSADIAAAFHTRIETGADIIFIAEVEGEAVGFIDCQISEGSDNPFVYRRPSLIVDQLSVEAAYRGKGVGHALMEQAYALARERGIQTIRLNVLAFNETAQRFYENEGFAVESLRMVKHLS